MTWIGSTTTQGDAVMNSNSARTTYNVNGAGIKIGIISDSFNRLGGMNAGITSGDLPGVGNPNGFTTPVNIVKDDPATYAADEGRGMAEIIHDVAPGAQMLFHSAFNNTNTSPGQTIGEAINALVAAGANIIVDDVATLDMPAYQDGKSAIAAHNAFLAGVPYFSSAGNSSNNAYEGIFTPPSLRGSIMSPGYAGGVNWGSLAFDVEHQLIIGAVNHIPTVVTLIPRRDYERSVAEAEQWPHSEFAEQRGTAFGLRREPLMSPLGLPCTPPPWGTLAAIDLKRNAIRWQIMLGSTRDKTPWFFPAATVGMPNMGGPAATNGGVIFIGAATDNYLRAFDVETGRELWKGRLLAGGQATPMTYEIEGRQFVVIAAGGHGGLDTTRGDFVVAFALP